MTAHIPPIQLAQPQAAEKKGAKGYSRQHVYPIVLICVLGLVASIGAFFEVSSLERQNRDEHFYRLAQEQSQALHSEIEASAAALRSIRGLFDASDHVSRAEFGSFIEALDVDSHIQALEWIPRVPHAERTAYSNLARQDGLPEFQFTERSSQGVIVPAEERDEYYPVYYVEPIAGNERAVGFDLGSSSTRLEALHQALSSGAEVASARITLVQETGEQFGFLIFIPIYDEGSVPTNAQSRKDLLRGFGLGVYRMGDLVASASAMARTDISDINMFIFDKTADPGQQLLYPKGSEFESDDSIPSDLRYVTDIDFSGREWRMVSVPSSGSIFAKAPMTPWLVMVLGLFITGLAALYFNVVHGRKLYADTLVETRTAELVAVNHQRGQILRKLQRSNEDLESFTFIASHDLKAPLRGIDNLVSWIVEDEESHLSEESKHNAERLRVRVNRLENLLDGLLEYSKLGRMEIVETSVDSRSMCQEIAEYLAPPEGFSINIGDKMPNFATSKPALQTVLNNLISNAVKHHDRDAGTISVSSEDLGAEFKFQVTDDGPGIDPSHHKRIFEAFQTLSPRSKVDTSGIGLALVARTVAAAGGVINVHSEVGKRGTTMSFTWAKKWPTLEG
ncbi:hypothetical protein EBB79_08030 [Parasedimentitalea marina]|uniref:histidine kinase n=1 Tax=Parasedimentitalea marina TaxID=2483033 RepID=A0A3T0N1G0_9RHOB|nr:CHASE domain-containing protein [Parasedimentitalea marina]AZV77846.1 hypothetical protein EBB79_08030 [Parasedimentitalea marina]